MEVDEEEKRERERERERPCVKKGQSEMVC